MALGITKHKFICLQAPSAAPAEEAEIATPYSENEQIKKQRHGSRNEFVYCIVAMSVRCLYATAADLET
jgi:hypothetical protein